MSNRKLTRTHCRQGHELAVTGFWWSYDGKGCLFRQCQECTRQRQRKWRLKHPDRVEAANDRRTALRRAKTGVIRRRPRDMDYARDRANQAAE